MKIHVKRFPKSLLTSVAKLSTGSNLFLIIKEEYWACRQKDVDFSAVSYFSEEFDLLGSSLLLNLKLLYQNGFSLSSLNGPLACKICLELSYFTEEK